MKCLVVGDPHLQYQKIDDCKVFVEKLIELSKGHDRVIILGDLFHTFAVIRSEILSLWNHFFKFHEAKEEVIVLVGNHDYASQDGGTNALEVFNSGNTRVVDALSSVSKKIVAVPFMRDVAAFEKMAAEIPADSILLCHQSFNGAQFDSGYFDPHGADPKCVSHLKAVISGHIHKEQRIGNIWYPGSPFQQSFGENGQKKRVYTISLTDSGYDVVEAHDLDMPEFVELEADANSLPEPVKTSSYKFVGKKAPSEINSFWSDERVKAFRGQVRRVVDGITPEKGEVLIVGADKKDKREKLDAFIQSKKWRSDTSRLIATSRTLLSGE